MINNLSNLETLRVTMDSEFYISGHLKLDKSIPEL